MRISLFLLLITAFSTNSIHSMVRTGIEVEAPADDGYYDDNGTVIIWTGPGVYSGVWFSTEGEYHTWYRRHHYHRYHRYHGHGGRGHRHGGGGHHHGGGGHHHGGGRH